MEQLKQRWNEILLKMKQEYDISDVSFNSWLKPLSVIKIEGKVLYIVFDNEESADIMGINYISKKYSTCLKVTIAELTGIEYEIVFISPQEAERMTPSPVKVNEPSYNNVINNDPNNTNSTLNPKFTFENYVVGKNNRFAATASLAAAETPGDCYNPLFLYGGPGLGKTHLMHAIGNFFLKNNPNKKVLYVTSEDFTNEVVEGIRSNATQSMQKLRDKYRTVDILMIDDIQFIIGKESTQEEFFNTFNKLLDFKKQIVISSDKPPKQMVILDERFRSRFEQGLMADIGHPDYETRLAIIQKKAEEKNFLLNKEVTDYIATNIKSNVREIEGAINKLIAFSNIEKQEITIEIAQRELVNFISPSIQREITAQYIIEVVADYFKISVDQMVSKSRSSDITRPRMIAMYLCKTMTDSSLEAVGSLLGGRDHSTIIHGANKIAGDYNKDEATKNLVDNIINILKPKS